MFVQMSFANSYVCCWILQKKTIGSRRLTREREKFYLQILFLKLFMSSNLLEKRFDTEQAVGRNPLFLRFL